MALVQLESIETGFHNSYGPGLRPATKGIKARKRTVFCENTEGSLQEK